MIVRSLLMVLWTAAALMASGCNSRNSQEQGGGGSAEFRDDNSSTVLSTSRAQAAIDVWARGHGSVQALGVQDVPAENVAYADVRLANFRVRIDGVEQEYSGPGKATFKHYSDGRWVLTRMDWGTDLMNTAWSDGLSITAP